MTIFAIDTNLLVYAHNLDSPLHQPAKKFIERVMNKRNKAGELSVCIPAQVFVEFTSVVTSKRLKKPLSLSEASDIVQDYLDTDIRILTPQETYVQNYLELLKQVTSRKRIFDVALAAILKDNAVSGVYTVNINDFQDFQFLEVINPLD